jgi:antitoxin component YwqK of YwqJK toxin-antitoxin module
VGKIETNYDGNKEIWYCKIFSDKPHRLNGPAHIRYYSNGKIKEETYYKNGEKHRKNGPAHIVYNHCGKIVQEAYYVNGKRHRINGPAIIIYYDNGNVKQEYYYIDGIEYDDIFQYSVMVGSK